MARSYAVGHRRGARRSPRLRRSAYRVWGQPWTSSSGRPARSVEDQLTEPPLRDL